LTSPQAGGFFVSKNMITNEFVHPTIEHFQAKKWDPFLQNEPESSEMSFLTQNETFIVGSAIEIADSSALDNARGELEGLIAEDSAEISVSTGFEAEISGIESDNEGFDVEGGNEGSEGGEGE